MDNIDKKKQYFKDSVYLKYENQKNIKRIQINKKKKLNKLQKIAVIIIVGMISLTAYAGISGNLSFEKVGLLKLSQNFEDGRVEINKTIETENCNIILESMAADSAYIIVEYRIEFKNDILKKMENMDYFKENGYNPSFDEKVLVNSQEMRNIIETSEKISENEYSIVQIINIMEITSNIFDIEIDLDRIYAGYLPFLTSDKNSIRIGKKISTRIELNVEINREMIAEQDIDEHIQIVLEKFSNAKFQTYIALKKVTEGITWEEYNSSNPMEYSSFIIANENDEVLSYDVYDGNTAGKKVYVKENGIYVERDIKRLQNTDIIKYEENFLMLMGNLENINKIKIIPVKTRIYDDRKVNKNGETEESIMYNKATWYPLSLGEKKYSATSGLGGTFEIEKIEADDENIYFYYNEKGLIGNEWKILIREKNIGFNYLHSTNQEKKGLNSGENKIVFSRDTSNTAGTSKRSERLENLEDFEFTLLFGSETKKVGKELILDIPELNEETAKINDIKVSDIKLKLTYEELERSPDVSSKYTKKGNLSAVYSKEDAIKDNCFVIDKDVVISNDKEQLDKFMDDCNNGKNGVIRIYMIDTFEFKYIMDIEYTDGRFFVEKYNVDSKQNVYGNYYGTTKLVKDKNDDETYIYRLIGENTFGIVCKIKM